MPSRDRDVPTGIVFVLCSGIACNPLRRQWAEAKVLHAGEGRILTSLRYTVPEKTLSSAR